MNLTNINNLLERDNNDQHTGYQAQLKNSSSTIKPKWLCLSKFEAETTAADKVNRVANNLVFGAAVYGIYSLATMSTGLLAYASYISMGFAVRKIISAIIGHLVYPAARTSFPYCGGDYITAYGNRAIRVLKNENFIVKKISLYKSGTKYDAFLVGHQDTIKNGNWTINALGNGMVAEFSISKLAKNNFANKCNTLLVNGPSVSESSGWPTRYQMGAGFEAGIRFLEQKVKATHIIMHGLSLGGGMMGEAILNHDFTGGMRKGIRYLSITDRSFSRLSTIAAALVDQIAKVGRVVKKIFYITGTELDGIAAARKLSQLGIKQIIIQHTSEDGAGSDKVILDRTSLAYELHKDPTLKDKIFLESELIRHNDSLPEDIEKGLRYQIHEFIAG